MKIGKPNFGPILHPFGLNTPGQNFSQKTALGHLLNQMTAQLHAKTLKSLTSGSGENLQTNRKRNKRTNGKKGQRFGGYFRGTSFYGS